MALIEELNRARQIVELLDEGDPDKKEILQNETDIFKLIDWAIRKDSELDTWITALRDIIKMYQARQKTMEARKERMRELILMMMTDINEKSYKGAYGTASIVALNPKPIIDDVELLPEKYVKVKKQPDLAAIKVAIKEGEAIEGVYLSNGGQSLTVRRK